VTVHDHVAYELPFGPVGRLAHWLRVRRQLEEIFAFRQKTIAEIFADAGSPRAGIARNPA
jgi:ligand-binding SRPBCC domain-containing protein